MKVSDSLINALMGFEGLRLKAYKADKSEKYYTIGVGHYGPDVKSTDVITKERAIELLRTDIAKFETGVAKLFPKATQNQFDALVDFAYNVGLANLQKSTLRKKILAGAPEKDIRVQFAAWKKCGGVVLAGLVKRRAWEADRYFGKV